MDEEDIDYLPRPNTNSLSVPNDPAMLAVYELYNPPLHVNRTILSEHNRDTFAEVLNNPSHLPTLAELCVRELARSGGTHMAVAAVREDPLKMRIHYDSLDVNLPLRECYYVEDESYWKRVVLAKSSDTCLSLKKLHEYEWRRKGLSLKYVELVEACPAALWPEQEMTELAELIQDQVRSMDIRHLQSLTEFAFRRKGNDDDDDTEPDISSEESGGMEISSDEPMTPDDGEEEGEEEEDEGGTETSHSSKKRVIGFSTKWNVEISDDEDSSGNERRKRRQDRNAARQRLRDLKATKQAEHEQRKLRRFEKQRPKDPEPRRKRKRKQRIEGAFDIRVEPEPDDHEDKVMDKRNKLKYLKQLQQQKYPEDDCWHIDLSFVRHFVNLVSLNLEFLGPALGREYHKRHVLFSVKDMVRLSRGLVALQQLQIFRLRNSRLNSFKLYPLCRALHVLPLLEVVDFGYDQITGDCGPELGMLLDRPSMLKTLELEYNRLDVRAMAAIGEALQRPSLKRLEYLGLAHNKMSGNALTILCNRIKGTEHVEELNVSGIEANPRIVVDEIGDLLRHHDPLRRLKMATIPVGSKMGINLICALSGNMKITHFDCRDCDLDEDEELDADLVVRRNIFMNENSYISDTDRFPTTADVVEFAKTLKHPMVQKIEEDMAKRDECFQHYPPPTPSVHSMMHQSVVAEESDYDMWHVFGTTTKRVTRDTASLGELDHKSSSASVPNKEPFRYEPNNFDLEEFREHVYQPGPANRHSYLVKQRNSLI
ncbi:uncharacterized protein LOC108039957 [Drosophila rhopaloa]|uniref:Uncharacterized protein LOC108039957 n=1 Tax=Drosophila rhopaloa TaxID=1041015 RepID=A0A6P4EH71_DRORH|nr:uncharacterized protein LOC108039957 [Drosophila rhopaloa]